MQKIQEGNAAAGKAAVYVQFCRDKTAIVIAHRLNTIASADKVVVLDEGRVVEMGLQEELLSTGGTYARMVFAAEAAGEWSEGAR